jgi:hypothetical protein
VTRQCFVLSTAKPVVAGEAERTTVIVD